MGLTNTAEDWVPIMGHSRGADKHNSLNGILEGGCGAAVITCALQFSSQDASVEVREPCLSKMHDLISSHLGWKVGKV